MNKAIITINKTLGETNYIYTHETGLRIIISPKKGFSKTTVMFGTNFGSVTNKYYDNVAHSEIILPDGIAHFLEHKLFEAEDGDAFTKYAKTGASANAYTSFTNTVYYFTCTDKVKENIKILVELMQTPYFTKENVNKEQGIIGQEINMYLDSPDWRVYFNMLTAMYKLNPVRIDIAGSVESISEITPELLYECYSKFYAGKNMAISVCGDVDPDEIATYIDTLLTKINPSADITVDEVDEPEETEKNYITQTLDVSIPIFNIGFKSNRTGFVGKDYAKLCCIGKCALDILFGKSSLFYDTMYKKGYINDSFGTEFSCEKQFVNSILSGESNNIEGLTIEVQKTIDKATNDGITDREFERQSKITKSSYIKMFNSPESVARFAMECYFNGHNILEHMEIINSITKTDIEDFIKTMTKEKRVVSVILPKNKVD